MYKWQVVFGKLLLLFYFLAGEDFIPLTTNLVFGEELDVEKCVYIPIVNNDCVEDAEEYFTVTISSDMDCVVFANSTVHAVIHDDDCKPKRNNGALGGVMCVCVLSKFQTSRNVLVGCAMCVLSFRCCV